MAPITTTDIQNLRRQTGVGILEAKKALTAAGGDQKLAIDNLRKAGKKMADAKSARSANEGTIGTYVHANGKIAALVAVGCETDFVARTPDFQALAHEIAIHIAAANPQYIQPSDVPAEMIAKEKEIYASQLASEGKPEKLWESIIAGKLKKYYADVCLLNQPFVKDDQQTISDLLQSAVAKLGENIVINSFTRLTV